MGNDSLMGRSATVLAEILSATGLPGSSLLAKAVEQETERRKRVALELIIEALARGETDGIHIGTNNDDAEQFAGMLLRFMSAARDGAAKKNLQLMACDQRSDSCAFK